MARIADYNDIINKKFGKLKVLSLDTERNLLIQERVKRGEIKRILVYYICICDCNKTKSILRGSLMLHRTKSCGCIVPENIRLNNKNEYFIDGDYVFIKPTNSCGLIVIDKEDLEKVLIYNWGVTYTEKRTHYPSTMGFEKKKILIHKLITNTDKNTVVDHIKDFNYNGTIIPKELNNTKENLRIVTNSQNNMNSKTRSNNKSGVTGVSWDKDRNKWYARISINSEDTSLGYFINKDDAIEARKEAENKYYGDYSYSNSQNKEVI